MSEAQGKAGDDPLFFQFAHPLVYSRGNKIDLSGKLQIADLAVLPEQIENSLVDIVHIRLQKKLHLRKYTAETPLFQEIRPFCGKFLCFLQFFLDIAMQMGYTHTEVSTPCRSLPIAP